MKNKSLNIASILTLLPFLVVVIISYFFAPKNVENSTYVFAFYIFILFQIISVIIVGKDMIIKKSNDGWFIIVANILVTLFMLWLIGFSSIQG